MNKEKNILLNYILYFATFFVICIIGASNVFGATITDYSTKYYWYVSNNNSSTTSTEYRSGSGNRVTLNGASAPTYDNGEGFNGFDNKINYSLTKGSIYTLSLAVSFSSLQQGEFNNSTIQDRLLSTTFAHCSDCTITAVSGSTRTYNSTNQSISGLYDYVVQMSYTFVATSNASTWYIGSYTGDDRTLGVDNHLYNSIVMVNNLEISNDNSSTIINQNDTIINQNQQMIDQNQQNTQNIIDSNTQNTQDIINNNDTNTNKIIENDKVCTIYDASNLYKKNKYLNDNGEVISVSGTWGITDFINIQNANIEVLNSITWSTSTNTCFYNNQKEKVSCIRTNNISLGNFDIPDNSYYVRFTIDYTNSRPQFKVCKSGNNAINDSINGLNDSLNDDDSSGATSEASDFFSSFSTNTFGLTSIITAPLNLVRSVLSSTCTDLQLPLPYLDNKKLTLPCMSTIYSQFFGSFFTIYQTITYGIIAYWVCVRIFNQVKDFKNPEHDEIEVMDL